MFVLLLGTLRTLDEESEWGEKGDIYQPKEIENRHLGPNVLRFS
jgi:hypothetical protein